MSPYREPAKRDEYPPEPCCEICDSPEDKYLDTLKSMWWQLNGSYRVSKVTHRLEGRPWWNREYPAYL